MSCASSKSRGVVRNKRKATLERYTPVPPKPWGLEEKPDDLISSRHHTSGKPSEFAEEYAWILDPIPREDPSSEQPRIAKVEAPDVSDQLLLNGTEETELIHSSKVCAFRLACRVGYLS